MWRYFKGVCFFVLALALLPLVVAFLVKLLVVAGTWTLQSITEPLYAGAAGVTFLVILGVGIWIVLSINSDRKLQPPGESALRPVAFCNACGKPNWANVPNCHYCGTQIRVSRTG